MPQRPSSAAEALAFITATLTPAVSTIQSGAQAAQADAEREAREAGDAKVTAEQTRVAAEEAIAKHTKEQAEAEAQAQVAADKAAQAQKVGKELKVVETMYSLVPDLPEGRQPALQAIANEQLDELMADLGMSFDPPAPPETPAGAGAATS